MAEHVAYNRAQREAGQQMAEAARQSRLEAQRAADDRLDAEDTARFATTAQHGGSSSSGDSTPPHIGDDGEVERVGEMVAASTPGPGPPG